MSRLLLWLAARLVPGPRREEWLERWRAELWSFESNPTRGTSPARFALGAWPDALAEAADGWREGWSLAGLSADVRDGWRAARRAPGATALAVLVLGAGTTAAASIFSLADAVLLRPLPALADPDRLVQVGRHDADRFDNFSFPNFADLEAGTASVIELAGYSSRGVVVGSGIDARVVPAQGVTANYFQVLGVSIREGPGFGQDDPKAFLTSQVVVVSEAFRRARAGAVRDGRVVINGHPHLVVGVVPDGFVGATTVSQPPQLWVPLGSVRTDSSGSAWIGERGHSWIFAIGRLLPGTTFEAARDVITDAHAGLARSAAGTIGETITIERGVGLQPAERLLAQRVIWLMFAVASIVLLVAAANVAGLQFSRGLRRRHEFAVRASLGAGRWRLWRALLVDQAILAAGGALVAFIVAGWTTAWLQRALPYPIAVALGPDVRLLLFALVASTATSTVVALWPLRRVVSGSAADSMRTRQPEAVNQRAGRVLVFIEVALATVLVSCGGLLVRSSLQATRIDPGFSTDAMIVSLRAQPGRDASGRVDALRAALRAVPGVTGVAVADALPIPDNNGRGFLPPGVSPDSGARPVRVTSAGVSPEFFDLIGLPVVAGRAIAAGDRVGAETPVVINRALGNAFWPDRDALDQVWSSAQSSYRVVGVVPDTRLGSLRDLGRPAMWTPLDPGEGLPARWLVRLAGSSADSAGRLRDAIEPFGQDVIISRVAPWATLVRESLGVLPVIMELLVAFAAAALLMAALGLYSISSLQVARQRQEIGVRIALGAPPGAVTRTVLRSSFVIALAGALVGASAAPVVAASMQALLFGIEPTDPVSFVAATFGAIAVAMLAAAGPARRAARTDPLRVLRGE